MNFLISGVLTAVAAAAAGSATTTANVDPNNPGDIPGVFECAASPAHFDLQSYDVAGLTLIDGSLDVLTVAPTKVWGGGAAFDLLRSADDKDFVRLLAQSARPPNREVRIVVHKAGEYETRVEVATAKRVERIPFTIELATSGATLTRLGDKVLNVRLADFKPAVARAVCFSGTAVFDGLTMPVLREKR